MPKKWVSSTGQAPWKLNKTLIKENLVCTFSDEVYVIKVIISKPSWLEVDRWIQRAIGLRVESTEHIIESNPIHHTQILGQRQNTGYGPDFCKKITFLHADRFWTVCHRESIVLIQIFFCDQIMFWSFEFFGRYWLLHIILILKSMKSMVFVVRCRESIVLVQIFSLIR